MGYMTMPLRRYFDFSGRSRRQEYWMFFLWQMLMYSGWAIFFFAAVPSGLTWTEEPIVLTLLLLPVAFLLFCTIPNLAVAVRRFHDQGFSGWMYLLHFIPWIGGLIVLVFMLLPGNSGANKYGADPKGVESYRDQLEAVFA